MLLLPTGCSSPSSLKCHLGFHKLGEAPRRSRARGLILPTGWGARAPGPWKAILGFTNLGGATPGARARLLLLPTGCSSPWSQKAHLGFHKLGRHPGGREPVGCPSRRDGALEPRVPEMQAGLTWPTSRAELACTPRPPASRPPGSVFAKFPGGTGATEPSWVSRMGGRPATWSHSANPTGGVCLHPTGANSKATGFSLCDVRGRRRGNGAILGHTNGGGGNLRVASPWAAPPNGMGRSSPRSLKDHLGFHESGGATPGSRARWLPLPDGVLAPVVPKRPFPGNDVFNANIARWDTAAVTNMNDVFCQATAFNQPLDSWDAAAVTGMNWMFAYAKAFNQHLPWWNTPDPRHFHSAHDWNIDSAAKVGSQPSRVRKNQGRRGKW